MSDITENFKSYAIIRDIREQSPRYVAMKL